MAKGAQRDGQKQAKDGATGKSRARRQDAHPPVRDLSTMRLPVVSEAVETTPTARYRTLATRRETDGGASPSQTAKRQTASQADQASQAAEEQPTTKLQRVTAPGSDGVDPLLSITTRQTALTPAVPTSVTAPAPLTARAADRPVVIRGSGRVISLNYVPRRQRPLVMRMAVLALTVCIIIAGLFAVVPLNGEGANAAHSTTAFQAIANAVIWHASPGFTWYTVNSGDTLDSVATKFKAQVGGILELNGMLSGEELQIGKSYKIPTDPNYGIYYRPANYSASYSGTNTSSGGYWDQTIYTDQIWSTMAGTPPDGALCGPAPRGSGDNLANYDPNTFDLKAPNWGAYWVRGFSWYHLGVDLANPEGTPIHAAQSGEVIFAAWDTGGGGWSVKINHCNHLSTAYGHMQQLLVRVHQMVRVGDVIGLEGSTGWSTGPHLHFSAQWDNNAVDPMQFFNYSQYNITHPLPDV